MYLFTPALFFLLQRFTVCLRCACFLIRCLFLPLPLLLSLSHPFLPPNPYPPLSFSYTHQHTHAHWALLDHSLWLQYAFKELPFSLFLNQDFNPSLLFSFWSWNSTRPGFIKIARVLLISIIFAAAVRGSVPSAVMWEKSPAPLLREPYTVLSAALDARGGSSGQGNRRGGKGTAVAVAAVLMVVVRGNAALVFTAWDWAGGAWERGESYVVLK